MKLAIDDLRVESYSTQVSELELTEIKGGTTPVCAFVVAHAGALITAAAAIAAAYIAGAASNNGSTTTTVHYDSNGKMVDSCVVNLVYK